MVIFRFRMVECFQQSFVIIKKKERNISYFSTDSSSELCTMSYDKRMTEVILLDNIFNLITIKNGV